jgi:PRTRC genetic system protein B
MKDNLKLSAPPDATGALFFLPGQYLFKRIENGRVSVKALSSEQISRAFREFQTDTGWLTRRVLRFREEPAGNYFFAFEPARVRSIWIETKAGEVREISVPLPTLILLGKQNEYFLWAAKTRKPTAKTKLCVAPLPNLGGEWQGKICFGSNEVPPASAATMDAVWNLIFSAPFNNHNANNKCRSEAQDVRLLLFALAEKEAKTFPASELIESATTVEDVWRQMIEGRGNRYF